MEKIEVKLEKDNNDFFREWIIKEWQHHNTVDPIYQLRIIKPEELKFKENEEYYKILYNNKMVGFIGIKNYEKEIYLYRFFIDEKYRNNGIGTIALNQIIELAKVQNKDLSLEVIGENIARDLYERLGFKTHYRRMILKINVVTALAIFVTISDTPLLIAFNKKDVSHRNFSKYSLRFFRLYTNTGTAAPIP